MSVALDTSQFERSLLNEDKRVNVPRILLTLDTSHVETSPLNSSAPSKGMWSASKNNPLRSVTRETSQDVIPPSGPLEQSFDSSRHFSMAAWSVALDF